MSASNKPSCLFTPYVSVLRFGIQSSVVYRVNFLVQAAFNLVPLFTGLAVWRTIYAAGTLEIAGYTAAQMLSYYLIAALVEALTGVTEDDWQIAAEIKDGRISQFLLRPLDYMGYRLCMFAAGRFVFSLAAVLPVGLCLLLNADVLVPCASALHFGLFAFSVACSALNQFLMAFLTATLAFWVLEVSTFTFVMLAFQRLAGGLMFPLDLLPSGLQKALIFSPFACQVYLPVQIYLGRAGGMTLADCVSLELLWMVVLYGLARLVWSRGLRAYGAYGG